MPHAPAETLTDKLARAFVDILRREAGQHRKPLAASPDEALDLLLGELEQPEDEGSQPLRPDVVGAAVCLARAIEAEDGLLKAFRRGAPVVSVRAPSAEWVEVVDLALRACALGSKTRVHEGDRTSRDTFSTPSRREALIYARDGSSTTHRSDRGNGTVGSASQVGLTVVGVAVDPERQLPRDLMRITEFRLTLPGLDAAALNLVVEAVTGSAPGRHLDEAVARQCDPSDLLLAVRRDRGADGSLDRLEGFLRARTSGEGGGPRLEELHGYGEAREWGQALVQDLRLWREGGLRYADMETSILLSGPPGVGKTRFAMALARSSGLPFLAGSLGQWQSARDGHLGHTLAAMRAFFDDARRKAPCVVLIDELDSFGDRASFPSDHKDYSTQVVNALLELLDGAVSREGVIVVGATNNPDRIDPAIRRSGRIDRHVRIGLPDMAALRGILRHYLGEELADEDLTPVALDARGRSGADMEVAVRRARGVARRAGRAVTLADLTEAVTGGVRDVDPGERWRTAIHEAGHGLAAVRTDVDGSVALMLQANGGGLMEWQLPSNLGAPTEALLTRHLVVLLAGRAAEEAVLGDVSAGAVQDLRLATRGATLMETQWGFSAEHPLATLGDDEVDLARVPWLLKPVHARLRAAYDTALALMREEHGVLRQLAAALADRGYLEDAEVRSLASPRPGDDAVPDWEPGEDEAALEAVAG